MTECLVLNVAGDIHDKILPAFNLFTTIQFCFTLCHKLSALVFLLKCAITSTAVIQH